MESPSLTPKSLEIFRSEDGTVSKFIHADGDETAIKCVPSQTTFVNPKTGTVSTSFSDRKKWSLFISSSVGCFMKCKFCHLTSKNCAFVKLSSRQVVEHLKEAIESEIAFRPEMSERWVKICWMGMGDAIADPDMIVSATLEILDWIMDNGYAQGLDGVDVSTVIPPVSPRWVDHLVILNGVLSTRGYPINPNNSSVEQAQLTTHTSYSDRSIVRVFYSLLSAIQETRDFMTPKALPLSEAVPLLKKLDHAGIRTLIHQIFVSGLNDSDIEVDALIDLMNTEFPHSELRVLRYNHCDQSPYHEWERVPEIVKRLATKIPLLKVQESAGSEVQAACGQFLVSRIVKPERN